MTGGEGTGFTGSTKEKGERICSFTNEVGNYTQRSLNDGLRRFDLERYGLDWHAAATIYKLGDAQPGKGNPSDAASI